MARLASFRLFNEVAHFPAHSVFIDHKWGDEGRIQPTQRPERSSVGFDMPGPSSDINPIYMPSALRTTAFPTQAVYKYMVNALATLNLSFIA